MSLYIQKTKTTHFRCGGNGWFHACWMAPNHGNTEIICGCAILWIANRSSSLIDEWWNDWWNCNAFNPWFWMGWYVYIPKAKLRKKVVVAQRLFEPKALHICPCAEVHSCKASRCIQKANPVKSPTKGKSTYGKTTCGKSRRGKTCAGFSSIGKSRTSKY